LGNESLLNANKGQAREGMNSTGTTGKGTAKKTNSFLHLHIRTPYIEAPHQWSRCYDSLQVYL